MKRKLVECIKYVEREHSLRPLIRRREPTSPEQLHIARGSGRVDTVTKVHIEVEKSISVKDDEVGGSSLRAQAGATIMPKLEPLTEIFEGEFYEK